MIYTSFQGQSTELILRYLAEEKVQGPNNSNILRYRTDESEIEFKESRIQQFF